MEHASEMAPAMNLRGAAPMTDHRHSGTSGHRHLNEQQRAFVLARLRSYGPTFDYELVVEGWASDPATRVAELCAEGYHIEALRTFRRLPDGSDGWAVLYVMRVKDAKTGTVIAAPAPLGMGPALERWAT